MIVVDIGCCSWGEDRSIDRLIRRFQPEVLYGFDPYPEVGEGTYVQDGTKVVIERKAAWTFDGTLTFQPNGSSSRVVGLGTLEAIEVECFDLAAWLMTLPNDVVLKIDAEGSEYALIPHLGIAFSRVSLLLVEFHLDCTYPPIPVPWETWV